MTEAVLIAPGVQVTIDDKRIVKVATCISAAAAEDAAIAFADDEDGLGCEQVLTFGAWVASSPDGWRESLIT